MGEERRVGWALAILLGWYLVLGAAGYAVLRSWTPESGLGFLLAPIIAVAAVIVAPTTLAILAQNRRRRLGSFPLATLSAAAGLVFAVVAGLIAVAVR